ncbi:helix-turn-helix domain-containing protein [uncultured Peptoniphilus sp.]|uniref:helix-turn-helix domain-containing protein n=1 Tax=uncultured Peptoniphilus sp. TaxID=254354 RepID=UPI00261B2DCF|nr:helix-turn-helix domain-containing protein [uncultured Peptoniphilus sp.]
MAKYSYEFKRKLVDGYLKGKTRYCQLEEKYGVNNTQIIKWVNNFKEFGAEGLKRSRNNREHSVEFKLEAITRYETTELSYQQLALELGIHNYSLIANWRRKYKENGIDGLHSKEVDRPMKGKSNKIQDSSHLKQNIMSLETREQLENRIKELEAENRKLTIQKNSGNS